MLATFGEHSVKSTERRPTTAGWPPAGRRLAGAFEADKAASVLLRWCRDNFPSWLINRPDYREPSARYVVSARSHRGNYARERPRRTNEPALSKKPHARAHPPARVVRTYRHRRTCAHTQKGLPAEFNAPIVVRLNHPVEGSSVTSRLDREEIKRSEISRSMGICRRRVW